MRYILLPLFLVIYLTSNAQYGFVDHWETIVYPYDTWRYFEGDQQPPSGWNTTNFNDATWKSGPGGFGFEDGDDSTLIPYDTSVYMRIEFNIFDTTEVNAMILSGDFDDGFVAYLNGIECARENVGTPWVEPPYNEEATYAMEARLYKGLEPLQYIIRREQLNYLIRPGKNVLAIQVHNKFGGGLDMSSNFFLHVGLRNTNTYYRNNPTWFHEPLYFEAGSHLPVINITASGVNENFKVPGKMEIHYDKNGGLNPFQGKGNDYSGDVTIKYRGNSTLAFPKKSFRFETVDANGNNLDQDLLGFDLENDWVLYAPYSDKSLLRNYLTYNVGSKFLDYSPPTKFVDVMFNDYFLGTYVFTEKIKRDRNRVNISRLHVNDTAGVELTGGYILKIDWDSDTTYNAFTAKHDTIFPGYQNQTYQYYYPDADIIHPKQKKYIRDFITGFENVLLSKDFKDPVKGYHPYIDKESFADFFLVQELSKNVDAFRFSVYLYKENATDGGKVHMGPIWDFNLGYGNVNYGTEGAEYTYGWIYDGGGNRLFWYQKLLEDPAFASYLNCRWFELRNGPLHTDSVLATIDSGVVELGDAVYRNHDFWNTLGRYVWPNAFVGETYQEEIDYLKAWVTARLQWLDINMPSDCDQIASVGNEVAKANKFAFEVYPNPTNNIVFIENKYFEGETPTMVSLYDLHGKKVKQISPNGVNTLITLNIEDLSEGLYLLQIKDSKGAIYQTKVIKN